MKKKETIKVMIVDDHPVVRDGLEAMLLATGDMESVGGAGSGEQTLALCEQNLPDVILMDVVMPGMDGLEIAQVVLDRYPEVKIIMLTSFPEEDLVRRALEAGTTGYLLKNVTMGVMTNAIRSAYAGQSTFSPEATDALVQSKTKSRRLGDDLSDREREVLAMVVEGLSNEEIAERLVISPFTVKNHVSACISKLGVTNRTQAATMAIEHSLIPKSSSNLNR